MSIHLENTVISWKKNLSVGFRLNAQSKHVELKKVGQAKMIQLLVLPRLQDEDAKSSRCIIVISLMSEYSQVRNSGY